VAHPLNIAILAHEFPALSETFVIAHATGLIDLGHNITILANRPRADPQTHGDVTGYRLAERTIYGGMGEPKVQRAVRGAGRLAAQAVLHPPAAWRAATARDYQASIGTLHLLDWWTRLRRLPKFDVIHAHFGPMGRTAAALRAIGALEGRLVTTFHGVDVSKSLLSDPDMYADLFRTGDAFLPVSEYWKGRLMEHGCPFERIHVHHMGIDIGRFPFRARQTTGRGRNGRPLRAITIGRLVEKKGIEYALEAVSLFAHRGYPVIHTIVGDGPLRAHLERVAGRLGITENVRFLGARDHRNVQQLLYQSDVMLAPSTTDGDGDQEGIPVTLMEAMASGLPVISTLHSGIPELVEHGTSGLLVVERDVEGLAAALQDVVKTDGLARRLAEAGRVAVERDFNQERLLHDLVDYYEELLDTPPQRAAAEPEWSRFIHPRAGRPHPTGAFRS
jgi:colanic acid/amylovoran biosynthesis glycosyltransferase